MKKTPDMIGLFLNAAGMIACILTMTRAIALRETAWVIIFTLFAFGNALFVARYLRGLK